MIETETRELSSVSRGKIRSGHNDDWKNEKLFVPPLPPTNLRGCHLIRIQYDVFVSNFFATEICFLNRRMRNESLFLTDEKNNSIINLFHLGLLNVMKIPSLI